ncbi:MAG: MASE3 domain-containing protein [Candidatus Thorarchaeota archaeon]
MLSKVEKTEILSRKKYRSSIVIFVLILFFIFLTYFYRFLLFHAIAELFSVVIAFGIFMIGWNTRKNIESSIFLVLGVSLLYIGSIDLIHTLAYSGMNIFEGYNANLPTQLWITARYLQSGSFLMAFLLMHKKINPNYLLIGYTVITLLLLILIFTRVFPDCYTEGIGLTPFKIISEYIIIGILAISMILLYKNRKELNLTTFRLKMFSILSFIVAEFAFTFYVTVYDLPILIGHLFKIVSFYLIYLAIIQKGFQDPLNTLFTKLKESEKFTTTALNAQMDTFFVFDPVTGKAIRWNKAFKEISGYSDMEILSMKAPDSYYSQEDLIKAERAIRNAIETGNTLVQMELITKYGKKIPFEYLGSTITNDQGDINYIVAVGRNITERKKAEEEIKSIAKFPSENPNPILRTANEFILYINDAGERLFNIKIGDKVPPRLDNVIEQVFFTQKIQQVELKLNDQYYSFTITPIAKENYLNIYGLNITERVLAEGRIKNLVSTVSHELRTPITVLLMSLDLYKQKKDSITPEMHNSIIETEERNILLLKQLSEDLLLVSQVDEHKLKLDLSEYNSFKLLEKIIMFLEPFSQEKNVSFKLDVKEDLMLKGDIKRIDQIFRIILDNAIKYSYENTIIEISALENYQGEYNPKRVDGVLFQIINYGIGISKQDLPRIFERFFRASNVSDSSGTGLGLSIAKDLIELHQGKIFVESEFGEKTTFSLFFPRINSVQNNI